MNAWDCVAAMLIEEAFTLMQEEVADRIKGRHYSALVSAMANELVRVLRQSDVHGLIVEGSFTSIPDVVRHFKWGWLPVGPLITQRFEAVERIARVKAPVLVVHGSEDRLIPPSLGQALYERAPHPKRFVLVEGGSHHSTNAVGQPLYRQALADLFGLRASE